MKQNITIEDLMELSADQRDNLNNLWLPQKYDLAAGVLCKNAETNEYDVFEFIIGAVQIAEHRSGYYMTLWNLAHLASRFAAEETAEDTIEDASDEAEADETDMGEEDFEFNFEYCRPDSYSKDDCLPILNIGQMIDILKKCSYGNGSFYLDIQEDNYYGVGRAIMDYQSYGNDHEGEELCDVLWNAVKEIL